MKKGLEESGVDIMVDIIGTVWEEEEMPENWKQSEIVPIYKQKGDPLDCGHYRGIKLLEHGMKILEKIIEGRLRKTVEINPMQFGFMPGRGTTDAIFTFQQIKEKHQEKKVEMFTTFVDLEKAYDRVPRDLVYWSLRKREVPKKLIRLVKATYKRQQQWCAQLMAKQVSLRLRLDSTRDQALAPFSLPLC
ncbi:RNA-directed DNA polymerase (Reverse transcriptase) domain containing protein [Elysia marginata]|uniref:RNA-directed DNA polymerase (Reverse transcriptase) domain containing protein n=1 Tax=Elysia marginata TaxID=1093978 RepID=A0AAV4GAY0_9GAST|nr:RNA-directed DNA polymerase (Reverse transcriptase) domain containing protein [Elysia marginata]